MGNLINLGKEAGLKVPDGKNYRFLIDQNAYPDLTDVVSILGSGFLRSAFTYNSGANTRMSQIKIEIDGFVILDLNNTLELLGSKYAKGFAQYQNVGGGSTAIFALPHIFNAASTVGASVTNSGNYVFGSDATQNISTLGCLFFIGANIRFEKSIKISVKKGVNDLKTVCEYYLD